MNTQVDPRHFRPLEVLQAQAQRSTFQIEDIDWARKVDRTKPWAPYELAPWFYLKSFQQLSESQKLRYNQLFGLATAELFIWFESDLVCKVLGSILTQEKLSNLFRNNVEIFIAEEIKHSEMFWMLLQKAEPALYPRRNPKFFVPSFGRFLAEKILVGAPLISLAWIWASIMMEERTLSYSSHYFEKRDEIDPLFVSVHYEHMKDEARHVQMDVHFLKALYDTSATWKRNLAAWVLGKFVKSYLVPRRMMKNIISQMKLEFPDINPEVLLAIQSETEELAHSLEFQKSRLSFQAMPRFRSLLSGYKEMRGIHQMLSEITGDRNA